MSRIKHYLIEYPGYVFVELQQLQDHSTLWVSGPYGTWFLHLEDRLTTFAQLSLRALRIQPLFFQSWIKQYYNKAWRSTNSGTISHLNAIGGLIKRMVVTAAVGIKKYIRVRGVGYKLVRQNDSIRATAGLTHTIIQKLPYGTQTVFSRKCRVARLHGKSLVQLTGALAALRSLRKPDIYKGKGLRYLRDVVRKKPGKRKTKAVGKKKNLTNA